MNNKNVLLLFGKTAYDAMNGYLRELGAAFVKMGYNVDYLDGRDEDFPEKLYDTTLNNDYKFIMACNSILTGYDKLVLKDSIFCCLMFDHPACLFERIDIADESVLIIHCDLRGAEYIARYCSNVGSVGFVPLSGSYIEHRIPFSEREYDVVFTGSNNCSKEIYEKRILTLSADNRQIADKLIGIMKDDPMLMQQDALSMLLEYNNISVNDRQFYIMMARLSGVEAYMRAWVREEVVRTIIDSGIKIHIFGNGWEKLECEHPENIIRMDGYGDISLQAVANSKISLNVMPWFRGGFQERIASAMLCGTIALTDTSTYIEENFNNMEDIVLYDLKNIAQIPEIIKEVLSDEDKAAGIAAKGYEKAINGHTWYHRACEMMETIDDSISWLTEVRNHADGNAKEYQPDVSVIVPVYNAESTLGNCLGNLVNQTLNNIEIIIVDDCSTDRSPELIRSCQIQYPYTVKVIFSDKKLGPGGARNLGIACATGKYIGFADADDIMDVTMYQKMYEKAVSDDYDIVDVGFYKEETDENILYVGDDCTGLLDDKKRSQLIFGAGGYIWSKIFKRELFEGVAQPFRENCILEDCDFMIWMFGKVRKIGTIKEVLYVYKYYPGSVSRSQELMFYYNNVYQAIEALNLRLSGLDNYQGIKEAVEAIIYKIYSCALNRCIMENCDSRIVSGNELIANLVKLKNKTTQSDYDNNKYVKLELNKADIDIMKKIDELY